MAITAASLAGSHNSASPIKAIQPATFSIDTSTSRSHSSRGTRRLCRCASASSASRRGTDHAAQPRDDSGGNSLSRCFVIGQLSPQPTEVMARNMRPAGVIAPRAGVGFGSVMGGQPARATGAQAESRAGRTMPSFTGQWPSTGRHASPDLP